MGGVGAVAGPLGWLPPRLGLLAPNPGRGTPPGRLRGLAIRTLSFAAALGKAAALLRAGAPADGRE